MKFIITISLIFAFNLSQAQQVYKVKIVDGMTNEVIQGANFSLVDTDRGGASDENGELSLRIFQLPADFVITHVAYETVERTISAIPNFTDVIYLYPRNDVIQEVTITSKNMVTPLSSVEEYSVYDFEIVNQEIFQLEYHDIFQKFHLSITDLKGEEIQQISLSDLKGVDELYLSCNNVVYLLSKNYAYSIAKREGQYVLSDEIGIDNFNKSVLVCKLKMDNEYFFIREHHNGLMKEVTSYNVDKGNHALLKVIAEDDMIKGLHENDRLIAVGQGRVADSEMTQYEKIHLRKIQAKSDFLLFNFFTPAFPIMISQHNGHLVLFDHIGQAIEIYKGDKMKSKVKMNYVLDEKWMKQLSVDVKTENVYGVFNLSTGIGVKKINLLNGEVDLVSIVETDLKHRKTIKIHNNSIYYLRSNTLDGSKMELCSINL